MIQVGVRGNKEVDMRDFQRVPDIGVHHSGCGFRSAVNHHDFSVTKDYCAVALPDIQEVNLKAVRGSCLRPDRKSRRMQKTSTNTFFMITPPFCRESFRFMIILQAQLMEIHNDPGKITAVILRTEETDQERNETYKGQKGGQVYDVSDMRRRGCRNKGR